MSFRAPVIAYESVRHPNADTLELAVIGSYRSACKLGQFEDGQKVAYIPEDSLVPWDIIEELGLADPPRLAGSKKNRVKPIRLRQVLSQGLIYGGDRINDLFIGDDAVEALGLVKWEPEIPSTMDGLVVAGIKYTFDIENIKHWPDILPKGADVVITEKIHGTFCCLGVKDDDDRVTHDQVTSKGMMSRGLRFDVDAPENETNIYVQAWKRYGKAIHIYQMISSNYIGELLVFGEICGPKVQDLKYGLTERQFRIFDVRINGEYQSWNFVENFAATQGLETVPVLLKSEWQPGLIEHFTDGPSTIESAEHIREGCVVRTNEPTRIDHRPDGLYGPGRLIFKSVSEAHLFRRGGTDLH